MDTGRTYKQHTERLWPRFEPRTLLWGDSATQSLISTHSTPAYAPHTSPVTAETSWKVGANQAHWVLDWLRKYFLIAFLFCFLEQPLRCVSDARLRHRTPNTPAVLLSWVREVGVKRNPLNGFFSPFFAFSLERKTFSVFPPSGRIAQRDKNIPAPTSKDSLDKDGTQLAAMVYGVILGKPDYENNGKK